MALFPSRFTYRLTAHTRHRPGTMEFSTCHVIICAIHRLACNVCTALRISMSTHCPCYTHDQPLLRLYSVLASTPCSFNLQRGKKTRPRFQLFTTHCVVFTGSSKVIRYLCDVYCLISYGDVSVWSIGGEGRFCWDVCGPGLFGTSQ